MAESIEIRLDQPLEASIERILRAALELENGNRSRAARRLGISLRTMQRYAARSALPGCREGDESSADRGLEEEEAIAGSTVPTGAFSVSR